MPDVSTRERVVPTRSVNAALAVLLASACGGSASSTADIDGESTGGSSSRSPNVAAGGSTGTATPGGSNPTAPTTAGDGSGVLVGSPATPFGPGAPPPELARVEDDSPGPEPVNGVCPAGTEPVDPASCTSLEKRGLRPPPCVCQYVCSPACGSGEVCAPEAASGASACRCHAALAPSDEGCTWTGLLQNASFEDDSGWKLWTSGLASASSANIGDGELRLEITARCAYAWAGTAARLPSRDQFPNGAALAFDYDSNARADDAGTPRVFLDGMLHVSLPRTSGRVTERHCVQLQDVPRLTSLYFDVETYGTCAEPLDYRLIVTDVRLEANSGCL
jgi:hypothetical protein